MFEISSQIVNATFWIVAICALIIKLGKWIKISTVSSQDFMKLQIKYFIVFFANQIPIMFTGPFVYQRYVDDGLNLSQIAQIKIVFNLSAAFLSFLAGPVLHAIGHRMVIITSMVCSFICCFLRYYGGVVNFYIGVILLGFSSPMNGVAFSDWFLLEESSIKDCEGSHFIFTENNAVIQLVLSIILTPIADLTHTKFGSEGIFFIAGIMFAIAVIPAAIILKAPSKKKEDKKDNVGYAQAIASIKESKDSRLKPFLIVDCAYSLIPFIFSPNIVSFFKGCDIPNASLSGSIVLAILIGAQFLGWFDSVYHTSYIITLYFFFDFVLMILMVTQYDYKLLLYFYVFAFSFCDGGLQSLMLSYKKELYPAQYRGHIMGMVKVFSSILSSIILSIVKKVSYTYQFVLDAIVFAISIIITYIMIKKYAPPKKADKNKTE